MLLDNYVEKDVLEIFGYYYKFFVFRLVFILTFTFILYTGIYVYTHINYWVELLSGSVLIITRECMKYLLVCFGIYK